MLPKIVYKNFEIANITNNELFFVTFYELYPKYILNYAIDNNLNNFIIWFSTYNTNISINKTDLQNILISFIDPIEQFIAPTEQFIAPIEQEYILFLVQKFISGKLPNVINGEHILSTLQIRIGRNKKEIQNILINMNININNFKYFKRKGILNSEEYIIFQQINNAFLQTVDINILSILME